VVKVSVEKLEGSKVALTVEAPASVVDTAMDKAYKSVVKRVNVPGFRRGKAPRLILERHLGKEALYEEAMKEVLPEQYIEAVKETKIDPVDDPEFEDVNFKQGEPLTFKAVVYVMPEVQLSDYSDVCVPYEAPTVDDGEVDGQVTYLRERMAELRPLEDGEEIAAGDLVTAHVKGIEGGTFKADLEDDIPYAEAGKDNALVPGLGQALLGMKKGESKEFTGTYPATKPEEAAEVKDQPAEPAQPEQPKEAKFSVEIKEARRKHYPTDEDFLKNLSKASMDEVKEELKSRLVAIKTDSAKRQHSDKVEDALLEKATVEIPQVMIEHRQEELFERFVQRLQSAGANVDEYLRSTGRAPEEIGRDFAVQAEKEVKRDLVLDAVGAKEEIKVTEEALNNVVEALARETGKDTQAVRTTLELRGALEGIEQNLRRVEALKKIAVLAAEKAGTPLPEDKPAQVEAKTDEKVDEKTDEKTDEKPAEPEVK